MLSNEENELLTRIGPGTLMGNLMRQYWLPVMSSDELAAPDGRPQRVRLLGEDLIAFRDSGGRVGLLGDHCAHRGASLFFGRNEEGGLRCVYHGWKYDTQGFCLDMPNEPAESNFKDKIHHLAYPCVERGGVVWTYMGPSAAPPPFPEFEWTALPDDQHSFPYRALRECNWAQALEGDIDTSHLFILHARLNPEDPPSHGVYHPDRRPHLEVIPTDYGLMYAARRAQDAQHYYWRISHFLMPIFTVFPAFEDGTLPGHMWVPMDDERTMVWDLRWHPSNVLHRPGETEPAIGSMGELFPATSDPWGAWRPKANRTNDYMLDPMAQRTKNFTGIPSVPLQDTAVQESMGAVLDRSVEHLGTADAMIIQVRRRLLDAARALHEYGTVPPGVEEPWLYHVRSASVTLPTETNWIEATREWVSGRALTLALSQRERE